jgi:tetratricopeptide (TPR) repeat protein
MSKSNEPTSPDRTVASALLLSRIERAEMTAALNLASADGSRDPEAAFLFATALAQIGDHPGAAAAYSRADDLSPGNLYHLSAEAAFLNRIGRRQEAQKRMERMIDENPRSPWTQIARLRQSLRFEDRTDMQNEGTDPVGWPPVALYELHLLKTIHSRRQGTPQEAAGHLVQALTVVGYQSPFLLDAFDLLREEESSSLVPARRNRR